MSELAFDAIVFAGRGGFAGVDKSSGNVSRHEGNAADGAAQSHGGMPRSERLENQKRIHSVMVGVSGSSGESTREDFERGALHDPRAARSAFFRGQLPVRDPAL